MTELKAFYDGFSDALMASERDVVPSSVADGYAHRFAIYRNNVHRGLYDALGAAYPTVRKLVGDGFLINWRKGSFNPKPRVPDRLPFTELALPNFWQATRCAIACRICQISQGLNVPGLRSARPKTPRRFWPKSSAGLRISWRP